MKINRQQTTHLDSFQISAGLCCCRKATTYKFSTLKSIHTQSNRTRSEVFASMGLNNQSTLSIKSIPKQDNNDDASMDNSSTTDAGIISGSAESAEPPDQLVQQQHPAIIVKINEKNGWLALTFMLCCAVLYFNLVQCNKQAKKHL